MVSTKTKIRKFSFAPAPKQVCTDKHCPFHGNIAVRGRFFEGVVTSAKGQKTAIVTYEYLNLNRKYKRYSKKTSKFYAHNPPCINAQPGDEVLIGEVRPISKTKHFVILKKKTPSE